jgi:hypothetical protein
LENANESSPSEAMLLQWYAAILASYCWTAEPVHTFIKNEISKYFDRWRIGDSEKHYPYVMNVDKYTKYRMGTGKAKWDNLQEKIIAYEKEFLNEKEDLDEKEDPESKNDRYILHEGKYRKVKSGNAESVKLKGVDKRVNLKDINAWYIKEDDEYRATFDLQNYSATNGDSNTRCGKGSPEAMNYVVKKLMLDGNQIDIKFLQDFALGIDCSGFVTRAIASVMTTLQIPGPIQFETLGAGYGRLKTNATTLRSTGSDVLFSYTYNKEFAGGSVKAEPKNDFQFTFQPGDIIMKKKFKVVGKKKILQSGGFHIWIIEDASADSFVALDSTAADKKGPDRQVYSSLPKFTGEVALGKVREKNEETGKYEDFEYKLEFARPKVFSDINELSRRYVSYLKDKYS